MSLRNTIVRFGLSQKPKLGVHLLKHQKNLVKPILARIGVDVGLGYNPNHYKFWCVVAILNSAIFFNLQLFTPPSLVAILRFHLVSEPSSLFVLNR